MVWNLSFKTFNNNMCCAKPLQLCPTLCNPTDYCLPGSSVQGVLQARILEWAVISFLQGIFPTQWSNHISSVSFVSREFLTAELPGKPYQDYCSVIFSLSLFFNGVLFWFWYHDNATFIKWVWKCPLLSQLLQGLFSFCCSSVQSLSHVRLIVTPWIAARHASLSITNSWSSPRLTSIKSVIPSSHLILCRPLLLLPPIPPSIRVFSNESTLCMM